MSAEILVIVWFGGFTQETGPRDLGALPDEKQTYMRENL